MLTACLMAAGLIVGVTTLLSHLAGFGPFSSGADARALDARRRTFQWGLDEPAGPPVRDAQWLQAEGNRNDDRAHAVGNAGVWYCSHARRRSQYAATRCRARGSSPMSAVRPCSCGSFGRPRRVADTAPSACRCDGDDAGYTCRRELIDERGCCDTSSNSTIRYSCRGCVAPGLCCSTYELCVSCCLRPDEVRP